MYVALISHELEFNIFHNFVYFAIWKKNLIIYIYSLLLHIFVNPDSNYINKGLVSATVSVPGQYFNQYLNLLFENVETIFSKMNMMF